MGTVEDIQNDARMPGAAGLIAGVLILVMVAMAAVYDLPLPGGSVYGSRGQGIVLLAFIGLCALTVGYLELRRRR